MGLAVATGKPLVGVSALDALAVHAAGASIAREVASIATWVDAWRGDVYAARYRDGREVEPPVVASPASLLDSLEGTDVVFVGDGAAAYRDLIGTRLGGGARFADPLVPLLAGRVGLLAGEAIRRGERPSPDAIRPLYVRRPDAELARADRTSQ